MTISICTILEHTSKTEFLKITLYINYYVVQLVFQYLYFFKYSSKIKIIHYLSFSLSLSLNKMAGRSEKDITIS